MQNSQADVAREETLTTSRVYEGRVINLRLDQVVVGGVQRTREVVEHPGAAVIIAQPDPEHMVLVRQWRHAAGQRMWEVPAGTLDPGEAALTAAARELREETGYTAGQMVPLFAGYSAPGFSAELLHFFHATKLVAGPSAPDEGEELLMQIFSLGEMQEALSRGELPDAKTQLALFWALSRLS